MVQKEIDFQFSKFRYENSIFYIEGCSTKTWFSVEDINDKPDLVNLSQVKVKNLTDFITAGISLSIKEELKIAEIISIIRQSLHVPLTLDVMMHMITIQDKFKKEEWHNFYPGILFLGSKLTVKKATGWKRIHPSLQLAVGDVCYPTMQFKDFTKDRRGNFYGLWLPEIARANYTESNFSTAVSIQTSP